MYNKIASNKIAVKILQKTLCLSKGYDVSNFFTLTLCNQQVHFFKHLGVCHAASTKKIVGTQKFYVFHTTCALENVDVTRQIVTSVKLVLLWQYESANTCVPTQLP